RASWRSTRSASPASRAGDPSPTQPWRAGFPLSRTAGEGLGLGGVSPSPAPRERVPSAARRVRVRRTPIGGRMSGENLTQVLASKSATLEHEALPLEAHELARQCVLDYFGVALAGAGDELVRLLLDELTEAGGAAQASIIGHQHRLPTLSA